MNAPMTPMRSFCLGAALTLLAATPAAARPMPGSGEGRIFALIVTAMLVIFIAAGLYMIYSGIRNRRVAKASEVWPATGGTVLSSKVSARKSRGRKRKTATYQYEPAIRYRYRVAGTEYESSVIRFGDLARSSRALPEKLVAAYPEGATVAVRYDPDDPARATLETEAAGGRQVTMGVFFIAVTLCIAAVAMMLGLGSDLSPEVMERINSGSP